MKLLEALAEFLEGSNYPLMSDPSQLREMMTMSMGMSRSSEYYSLFLDFKYIEYIYHRAKGIGMYGRAMDIIRFKAQEVVKECYQILLQSYYKWIIRHASYPWMWWNKKDELKDDYEELDADMWYGNSYVRNAPQSVSSEVLVKIFLTRLQLLTNVAFMKAFKVSVQGTEPTVIFKTPLKKGIDITKPLRKEYESHPSKLVRGLKKTAKEGQSYAIVRIDSSASEQVDIDKFREFVVTTLQREVVKQYGGYESFIKVEFFKHFWPVYRYYEDTLLHYTPRQGDVVQGFLAVDDGLHKAHKYGRMGNHIGLTEEELDSLGDIDFDPANTREEVLDMFLKNFEVDIDTEPSTSRPPSG